MRSSDITPGSDYAIDITIDGHTPPRQHATETNPRWHGHVTSRQDDGRWRVHLTAIDHTTAVRANAIREPWTTHIARLEREHAATQKMLATRLTYEQFKQGDPCPTCQRPYWDDPTADPADVTATNDTWRDTHQCDPDRPANGWHGLADAPIHCSSCCPPPPPSDAIANHVAAIVTATDDERR